MMLIAYIATWLVPQGFFETVTLENGREAVIAGTYEVAETQIRLSIFDFLIAIPRALAAAQDIIFFVFIIGGVLAIARATGTIDALIGRMLERFGDKPYVLIFMVIFVFAMASGAIGTAGEYIPHEAGCHDSRRYGGDRLLYWIWCLCIQSFYCDGGATNCGCSFVFRSMASFNFIFTLCVDWFSPCVEIRENGSS